jgi:hypothetical protein
MGAALGEPASKGIMLAQPSFSLLHRLSQDTLLDGVQMAEPLPDGRFLGIIGLELETPVWDVAQALRLQPIQPRPGAHEIARAVNDPEVAAIIGRYSDFLGYELAIAPEVAVGDEAVALGRTFVALLRVRSLVEILVPAALSCSWSAATLNRVPPHSCAALLLEDNPNLLQLEDRRAVLLSDLNWIFDNLSVFTLLNQTLPAYNLAVDSLCQHNHQGNLRMAAAMLWSGTEALFGIKGELTYRLAAYIAAFLENASPERHDLFRTVKEEYNVRSRIVHGDLSDQERICQHIVVTRKILSRLICKITERQGIPSIEEIDRLLLCQTATHLAQASPIQEP